MPIGTVMSRLHRARQRLGDFAANVADAKGNDRGIAGGPRVLCT